MYRSALTAALLLAGCRRSPETKAIHLIDVFDKAKTEGTASKTSTTPAALWEFFKAAAGDTLGWKAGDGVTGLKVETSDGHSLPRTSLASETFDHLTRLPEWNWIRKLRPCPHWRLIPENERGSGFHPIPGIGLAVRRLFFWHGSDPVGEISF